MQYRGVKTIISATIIVWSILLLKDSQTFESADSYQNAAAPPSLDAFQNYEEMQKYINEKESRRLKKVANPLDDSYIDAYNFHHESPERVLVKRDVEPKESPQIFKFELADAKEPDEQTKELIRVHRGRQMDLENERNSNRTKRSAKFTEPKLIRFEVSDAKEPDEDTKELIRQSRARELKLPTERIATRTTRSPQKTARKSKRTRRSAQKTQPQFIQFELSDAKEPSFKVREMVQQITGSGNSSDRMDRRTNDTKDVDDSFMEESNRFFYQSLPLKSKRLVNAVPVKVQKIIDLMVKDKQAQANYKHSANKQHASVKPLGNVGAPVAENLITVYPTPAYAQNIVPVPVPAYKYPVNVLSPPPYQEHVRPAATAPAEIPHVVGKLQHYQFVPLSQLTHPIYQQQQIKYIAPSQASAPAEIPQVSAKQHRYHLVPLSQLDPNVYQQHSKNVEIIPAITQTLQEIQTAQQYVPPTSLNQITHNQIPPRYPYAKIVYLEPSYRNEKPLAVHSNQQRPQEPQTNEERLNLEHQQQLVSNRVIDQEQQQQHIQDIQEFKELSKLIDKSPTDQMHGLTYLLAKEMQRRKRLYAHRPQDNTSPILFHQNENSIAFGSAVSHPIQPEPEQIPISQPVLPTALPEPIVDLPPKSYNSIVDNGPHVNYVSQPSAAPVAPLQEYPKDASALGLSPNYQGIDNFKDSNPAQSHVSESSHEVQYAPKYAFGYRVRDFHSGNDFGHKEHRDIDGVTHGQYHILLPDGRVQNVIYHADDTGFHADVNFETGHP